jgi:quercetin dioxygenase-like cupin family protein
LLQALSAFLVAGTAAGAQTTGRGTVKNVFTHDLPDLALDGWAVSAVEVSYAPGEGSNPHRHPGITIAYVLEGAIESKVGDGPERTYGVGEMFIETPGQLHAVSRNASPDRPARLLAVLLAKKGVTLTTPAR